MSAEQDVHQVIRKCLESKQTDVHIGGYGLAEMPAELLQLVGTCQRLGLGRNSLSSLPSTFTQFTHLRYLNLRHNRFAQVPHVLCEMQLEILDLSRNLITELPAADFGSLMSLKVLSLSNNRLKQVPTYVAQMEQLQMLKLDGNPMPQLPRQYDGQSDSQWLQLFKTQLLTDKVTVTGAQLTCQQALEDYQMTRQNEVLEALAMSAVGFYSVACKLNAKYKLSVLDEQCGAVNGAIVEMLALMQNSAPVDSSKVTHLLMQLLDTLMLQARDLLSLMDTKHVKRVIMEVYCCTLDLQQVHLGSGQSRVETPSMSQFATPMQMPTRNLMQQQQQSSPKLTSHRSHNSSSNAGSFSNVSTVTIKQLMSHAVKAAQQAESVIQLVAHQSITDELQQDSQQAEQTAHKLTFISNRWQTDDDCDPQAPASREFHQAANSFIHAVTSFTMGTKHAAATDSLQVTRQLAQDLQTLTRATKSLALQLKQALA